MNLGGRQAFSKPTPHTDLGSSRVPSNGDFSVWPTRWAHLTRLSSLRAQDTLCTPRILTKTGRVTALLMGYGHADTATHPDLPSFSGMVTPSFQLLRQKPLALSFAPVSPSHSISKHCGATSTQGEPFTV